MAVGGFNSNATYTGLGTFTITAPVADQYQVFGKLRLPSIPQGDATASSVVVVVKQNSTTVYTGNAGARGFDNIVINAAAGDTISCITSSSAAVDQPINAVQMTVSVSQGPL